MRPETEVHAGDRTKCPKCDGTAVNITPVKTHSQVIAVYACQTPSCGFAFRADGRAFVKDIRQIKDVFRAATMGNKTLEEMLKGEKLSPAAKSLMTAKLMEYGVQMWFDGLKQGLVIGAVQHTPPKE